MNIILKSQQIIGYNLAVVWSNQYNILQKGMILNKTKITKKPHQTREADDKGSS